MFALHQLQDRVHIHPGGKEARSAQRVYGHWAWIVGPHRTDAWLRAKYIEGLENRLGRMEALLKRSGLVNEEDWGVTDLGTLEKRLAQQNNRQGEPLTPSKSPEGSTSTGTLARPLSSSQNTTPQLAQLTTPNRSTPSPNTTKENDQEKANTTDKEKAREEEVEALSDMMCSLVTNNCGETRYIGWFNYDVFQKTTKTSQVLPPASPFSLRKGYNG